MRWLRIRKGYTGVTLRNAKILQIKQITSLLNKKYSKISSKTTANADKISSLVLSTEKYTSNASLRRRWMREIRLSSDKTGVETGDSFLLSEGRTVEVLFGASAVGRNWFSQGFSGFGRVIPFIYAQIAGVFPP